ncbi:MAG: enoyl-CoA hydratase/isomerase family protein [Deltaproteobacteria bacterium]|nr:enoyl-CoA hydratase/isomerase family protein [Deltaproteobacteria bacterium]
MIQIDDQDGIAIIRLDRGVTNAINLDLVNELAEAVEHIRTDPRLRSLVLGSTSEKFFSIGFDIPQLFDLPENDLRAFFDAFNRVCLALFTLPKPTVAALTGHTIAGGCILSLCCDYRFMAEGRIWMGLNEIKLGVPVPHLPDCILRSLVGVRKARDMMETGEFCGPDESLAIGLVDDVCPREKVSEKAVERLRALGALPSLAFETIKRSRVEGIEKEVLERWGQKDREFLECWYCEEARILLKEAMEKF